MVSPEKVNVPLLVMPQPVPVMVMVPLDGIKDLVMSTVRVPPTLKEELGWELGVPEIVRLLKVKVPELVIPQAVPVMVIVPLEGEKLADEPLAKVPAMLKELAVETVAEAAVVKLKKVSVPPVLTILEPLLKIKVPAEGVKVPVTVKAPPTVAELEPVEIDPETFKLP